MAEHLPRQQLPWVLAANAMAMLLFGWPALLALLVAGMVFIWLRVLMLKRLGGTTGDTAGALLELAECAVLVALALAA